MLDRKYGTVADISDEVAWAAYQRKLEEERQRVAKVAVGTSVPLPTAKGGGVALDLNMSGLSKREKRKLRKKIKAAALAAAPLVTDVDHTDGALDDISAEDIPRCKTCGREFGSRNELFKHLRKKCTPAEAVYYPGQTLNPDAAKVVTRKKRKKKKK